MSPAGGPVGRRTALASAAWAGGLALAAGRVGAASAAVPNAAAARVTQAPPEAPMLAVWTRIEPVSGDARIALVQIDPVAKGQRAIAETVLPAQDAGSVAGVVREARGFAQARIAAAWGVPPGECRLEGRALVHRPSGRCVRLLEWADFG